MSNHLYQFSYEQLEQTYNSLSLGPIEPTFIRMGHETYAQFKRWLDEQGHLTPHPSGGVYFNGACAQASVHIPEGNICFVGGVHIIKLEER